MLVNVVQLWLYWKNVQQQQQRYLNVRPKISAIYDYRADLHGIRNRTIVM